MKEQLLKPDFIFEASWEVCNKVGGIYTVLSTRANTLQKEFCDKVFFIGPDFDDRIDNGLFLEDSDLFDEWKKYAFSTEHLKIRIGRWNIPGKPIVFLVRFEQFFSEKNRIYAEMWEDFRVDSLHAYGDYDESCMFAYAAAKVTESFYRYYVEDTHKVVFHAHEWMLGMSALYIQKYLPQIATIFTTHATSIGRSIAGNYKPLYDYLYAYDGDQMARELNMESKHSIEKQTAHHVDCFTTVSEITNKECTQLLQKTADVVLMNGFENDFVPKGIVFTNKRKQARKVMLKLANALTGEKFSDETLVVGTSGRYEFKNKGIDLFIDALAQLNQYEALSKQVIAYINVPGWVAQPREELLNRMKENKQYDTPLDYPMISHWLHNMQEDRILNKLREVGLDNYLGSKVKVIFVPCYLDGKDGILNLSYYDFLLGEDLSTYPSYYEPWGYTPLESIAFKVPTISTDLAGFGLWVESLGLGKEIEDGVTVLHRSDCNYNEVASNVACIISKYMNFSASEKNNIGKKAAGIAERALWKHFITYYYQAYDVALNNAYKRNNEK